VQFASFLSTAPDATQAADDIAEQLANAMPRPDLLMVFATPDRSPDPVWLPRLTGAAGDALVVGCEGGGVLASGLEVEHSPGLAVLAASLPEVTLDPVHLDRSMLVGAADTRTALASAIPADPAGILVLSDPYSFDLAQLLPTIAGQYPGVPLFGGQASGRTAPGPHQLFVRGRAVTGGALCVGLSGRVDIHTVVAQGCRPIGAPMFVTRCQGNLLQELDGRDPVEVLREVYEALGPDDQARFRQGQYLGIQMRDQTEYERGDFVIRHVLGVPEGGGGLAVAAPLEQYQVVQLHVRDARTSRDDLAERLDSYRGPAPAGALLFTCLGRGRGLYGEPHHDSRAFHDHLGEVALAGFFANGELGPVQEQPFVHGYTSVFALFSTPS